MLHTDIRGVSALRQEGTGAAPLAEAAREVVDDDLAGKRIIKSGEECRIARMVKQVEEFDGALAATLLLCLAMLVVSAHILA